MFSFVKVLTSCNHRVCVLRIRAGALQIRVGADQSRSKENTAEDTAMQSPALQLQSSDPQIHSHISRVLYLYIYIYIYVITCQECVC